MSALDAMLERMVWRGADARASAVAPDVSILASIHHWECRAEGDSVIASDQTCIVAVDGSLYRTSRLRQRLRDTCELGPDASASELVLAAYHAWGEDCVHELEGDFAFIIWDRARRRVVCARDFVGTRPLYYAQLSGTLVIASTVSAIVAHPEYRGALDVVAVGEAVAGFFNTPRRTCYSGISSLNAGCMLVRDVDGGERVRRFWEPPVFDTGEGPRLEDAAMELREAIGDATVERLPQSGPAALWLSGGWDSSAIFAAGSTTLSARSDRRALLPVSMSYPHGDPGREDESIHLIGTRYSRPIHWCRIEEVPLLPDGAETAAARRDTIFAHTFEAWNRSLARASRAISSRVVMTGIGGDVLFSASSLYMADLFRRGHWVSLGRDWYQQRGRTLRGFDRLVLRPSLGAAGRATMDWLLRRATTAGPFENGIPSWMSDSFVRRHGLRDRERFGPPNGNGPSLAATEAQWLLTAPFFADLRASLAEILLEEGVELRTPLLDRSIVALAARRSRSERVSGGETKRLLRLAMHGILPDELLAPRPERTGVTSKYLATELRGACRNRITAAFQAPLLADLGIVDAKKLKKEWDRFLQLTSGTVTGIRFYETYQAELWLRARLKSSSHATSFRTRSAIALTA